MNKNKAYIIGVGPGSSEYVCLYARKKIEEAAIIVGWERYSFKRVITTLRYLTKPQKKPEEQEKP